MIEVRCFGSLAQIAPHRDEINALNLVATRPDPFSTFEFLENFLKFEQALTQGQGMQLWYLAAFDAGRLIGYMALKKLRRRVLGINTSRLDFLISHDADRPQLVARPEHAVATSEAFYAYLLLRKREWSFLELCQQDAASSLFPPPATVRLSGYWVRQWPGMENGTVHPCWDSLDSYFHSLSKKFRSNVSRQMRRLLAAGNVEYIASSDPVTTPALLELYCGIEPNSWKWHTGVVIGQLPQRVEYLKGLLAAHQPMRVSIHLILLEGIPIAGLITGAFERGLYALHIVFDDALSQLAPGSAVALMGMRSAIEGRYASFDLLSGFGYYKVRWQARMSATRTAQIYRIGTPYFWHRALGDLARWVLPTNAHRGVLLANPARRGIPAQDDGPGLQTLTRPRLTVGERACIAGLVVKARQGRSEFLGSAELAALMPFATRPAGTPLASHAR